jgi:hypothetical protein
MRIGILITRVACVSFIALFLSSCASTHSSSGYYSYNSYYDPEEYAARLPEHMDTGGTKMVYVDPNVHAWGAYDKNGERVHGGIATAGGTVCPDDAVESDCHTNTGVHRITSMGDGSCKSRLYPRPHGGGLMPYCMFFSNGQALHGSPDGTVVEDNLSHGCVRMRIPDAEWLRYNFAQVGTKVIVEPYN